MISLIVLIVFSFFALSSMHLVNNVNKYGIKDPGGVEFLNIRLPAEEWFSQKLDHFDPTNERTWSQRYWVNSTFHISGGPAFLMIGGEATENAKWIVQGQWISYAEENNALCFLVEHRFYGDSKPLNDTSTENLKYLNSEQALADLAYFINGMNAKYESVSISKWIVFGGSYSGTLAAWLRLKYPHLVLGAVSSSGPLKAKVDFYEYLQVVRTSLASYKEECVTEVMKANTLLSILVESKIGLSKITEKFQLCEILKNDADDIANLFQNLAGNFAEVVQYNKDNRASNFSEITIDEVCDIMTIQESPMDTSLDRYAAVNKLLLSVSNTTCLSYKYQEYIKAMQKTDWKSANENGRQWFYQTCTEFGFYQTSSKPTDLFGSYFPVEFFTKQCEEIFGSKFNEQFLENAVKRTNIFYGALDINVGNIIFVHGSIDPWHALGLTEVAPDKPYEVIYINGTAHCADVYPSSPKDSVPLKEARKKIRSVIKSWLWDDKVRLSFRKGKLTLDFSI